jgi:hypothetical protein
MRALKRALEFVDATTSVGWSLYIAIWRAAALIVSGILVAVFVWFGATKLTGGATGPCPLIAELVSKGYLTTSFRT